MLTIMFLAAALQAAEPGVMGYWPFDGTLADASGQRHDAAGDRPAFAAGHAARALDGQWQGVSIADHPDLRLAPGLGIDTWIYFDKPATGYEVLVMKDLEYQLRVDGPNEGGRFSFFVHLAGGWEPRVTGSVPEAGKWYHLVATWTGTESILQINEERYSGARRGNPAPTTRPITVGHSGARIDDLHLLNPALARAKALAELLGNAPGEARTGFEGAGAWSGWKGLLGATSTDRGDHLAATLPGPSATVASPPLAVPLVGERYVSLDLDAPGVNTAMLAFVTDHGAGTAAVPLWGQGRTAAVDVSGLPQWSGTLRMLAVSLPDAGSHTIALRGVWVGKLPLGRPYVYLRSFAPARAIQRAGREEQLLAVARNPGATARNVKVSLTVPAGVELLSPAEQTLPDLLPDATALVEWRIRAARPVTGTARATIAADGQRSLSRDWSVAIQPAATAPQADYVPVPVPVPPRGVMTLMHYCPLWKEGTHYGWEKVEPWPERRPAIGWYDEGSPEVADWHIKYAVEHGVQGFIYCWYRKDLKPTITHFIGHALDDGLLHARYLPYFKFAINWENANAAGIKDRADLLDNLLPYWIEKYFKHPSYAKIDNKPILYMLTPRPFTQQLGGHAQVREALDAMRARCREAGFAGLIVICGVESADAAFLKQTREEGYDGTGAYGCWGPTKVPNQRDVEGVITVDYPSSVLGQEQIWRGKKKIDELPDVIDVMMGWDPRPWHGPTTQSYIAPASPAAWEAALRRAKALLDETPAGRLDRRLIIFDNWNEFGEGHYLEPCSGFGFGYLDAIKRVFCDPSPPCHDIVPEDLGLPTPERVYAERRAILGGFPQRPRTVKDHLIAQWSFEEDDASLARDSSACGFAGFKQDFVSAPGKAGKGFDCRGGSVTVAPHSLFTPPDGLTVELWCRPDVAEQSDRWMLNNIGMSDSGWRLGMDSGKPCFQVPRTEWSHSLKALEPLSLGVWHHVAATYDDETMRLYVDGKEVAHLERGGPITPSGASLCIGSYATGHSRAFFQGVMDEVRLWDRALTAEEIAAHAAQ